MNDTYLGIDLGTSSMKMVLTDSEKHILGQISEEYEAVQSQNGWSEIDPEIWFQAMRRGMHNIFEDQDPKNLKGIGVTGQMHTLIVMGEDGKPVRPAMMWNDTRTKELLPELKKKILEFPEGEYLSQTISTGSPAANLYWLKVYEIPEGTKNSKGRAIQNLLNIDSDDAVNAYLRVKSLNDQEYINSHYVLFCTKNGVIKKTSLEQYSRPRQNGVNAITIREDDRVIEVRMTNGNNEIIIANRNGRAIRFHEAAVRVMGRTATGVRGITLDDDGQDEVIGMICIKDLETESVMVVSEQGYGKRSDIEDYRKTNRGGKGVKTMNITEKTGKLVTIKSVTDENDLMIINKSGITIRLKVADVRIMGRATQGVRLINLEKRNDQIGSVCKVTSESLEDEVPEEEREGNIPSDPETNTPVNETEE